MVYSWLMICKCPEETNPADKWGTRGIAWVTGAALFATWRRERVQEVKPLVPLSVRLLHLEQLSCRTLMVLL